MNVEELIVALVGGIDKGTLTGKELVNLSVSQGRKGEMDLMPLVDIGGGDGIKKGFDDNGMLVFTSYPIKVK